MNIAAGSINFSSEKADKCSKRENGIDVGGRTHADRRQAAQLASVLARLGVAVHADTGELQRRMLDDATGIEEHRQALARTLRVPDNTDTTISFLATFHLPGPIHAGHFFNSVACCANGFLDCSFDRKELVIASDQLVHRTAVGIVFEGDEVANQIEEASLLEHAANQRLQFERRSWSIELTFNCAPNFEPFLVSGERTDARKQNRRERTGGSVSL